MVDGIPGDEIESREDAKRPVERLVMRLRQYNEWRRGTDFEQPEPVAIGRDIDDAIAAIERYIHLVEKYNELHSALEGLVNEQQPLGIDRPTYQLALRLLYA